MRQNLITRPGLNILPEHLKDVVLYKNKQHELENKRRVSQTKPYAASIIWLLKLPTYSIEFAIYKSPQKEERMLCSAHPTHIYLWERKCARARLYSLPPIQAPVCDQAISSHSRLSSKTWPDQIQICNINNSLCCGHFIS